MVRYVERTAFAFNSFSWDVLPCSLRLTFSSWSFSKRALTSSGTSFPLNDARKSLECYQWVILSSNRRINAPEVALALYHLLPLSNTFTLKIDLFEE